MDWEPQMHEKAPYQDDEVRLHVAFDEALSARALSSILNSVESAFEQAMRQALDTGLLFPFSTEQLARAKSIVDLKTGKWFKIHSCKRGSIELVGSVALGWVVGRLLEATLIKDIERAYDGSSLDRTVTALLRANVPNVRALFWNKAVASLRTLEGVAVRGIDTAFRAGTPNAVIDGRMYFNVEVTETDPLEQVARRAAGKNPRSRSRRRR